MAASTKRRSHLVRPAANSSCLASSVSLREPMVLTDCDLDEASFGYFMNLVEFFFESVSIDHVSIDRKSSDRKRLEIDEYLAVSIVKQEFKILRAADDLREEFRLEFNLQVCIQFEPHQIIQSTLGLFS